jgi:hypothetical protein
MAAAKLSDVPGESAVTGLIPTGFYASFVNNPND